MKRIRPSGTREPTGIDGQSKSTLLNSSRASCYCAISNRARLPRDWQQFPDTCHSKEIVHCKQSLLCAFISVKMSLVYAYILSVTALLANYIYVAVLAAKTKNLRYYFNISNTYLPIR